MIYEKKRLFNKIEKSLKDNFDEWRITVKTTKADGDYILENKFNKFQIVCNIWGDADISRPYEISIRSGWWFSFSADGTLLKIIQQRCKKFIQDSAIARYNTLSDFFDNRCCLIWNTRAVGVEHSELINHLLETLTGKTHAVACGRDVYIYFEKEEDMAFTILKHSDYLIL